MSSIIDKGIKDQLIDQLVEARMKHINWVSDVLKDNKFEAEPDHTKCDFGKWMGDVKDLLGEMEEYQDIDVPHRELHMVYQVLINNPDHSGLKQELKLLSYKLIEAVDLLEKRLSRVE